MATSEISEAPPVTSAASVEVNDGNNNEANDDNNNVGAANSSSNAVTPSTEQEVTLVVPRPPALPPRPPNLVLPHAGAVPRPPPAPYVMQSVSGHHNPYHERRQEERDSSIWKSMKKKYVLLCCLCGGLCLALGILYLVIYFVLGRYTTSLHYFQTLPLYIPAIVLSVTGLLVLCFVRRANRIGYLIKLCGICCLASAVLCVVVTVTTTVIHMNRLQTLRECVYQGSIQTCTCFAGFFDPTMTHHDATMRFVFAGTPNCEVVHGVLYSCLRALFGLSVIGILVCIFSCMLVYQLLSHERKKKYWEQLELRCRHLYHQHPHHQPRRPMQPPLGPTAASCGGYCATEDPRYYNLELYPWASRNPENDYWQQSQRANGNIYSPNPEAVGDAIEAAQQPPVLTRSLTMSFRNWFPWLSSRIASSTSEVTLRPSSIASSRANASAAAVNPTWRHSNPDSHYGFRQPPAAGRYQLPNSGTTPADLSHYSAIPSDHLPRYLWGPPPPYSQPPSIENIQAATEPSSQSPVINTTNTSSTTTNNPRTTRSGLLKDYDDTVKSAMHLYKSNIINSNSLPSRRIRKNAKNFKSYMAQSVANLQRSLKEEEEAALFTEVRQKLNALNGMYRYQHSKAAQELAEIRRALNSLQTSGPGGVYKQNLPLPPIPKKDSSSSAMMIYQAPSVVSSNSCSTENKYETIGKSLEPYKISSDSQEPQKKPKRLPSTGSSCSSAASSSGHDYGFASSVSPMSVATGQTNGSQSPSSSGDEITNNERSSKTGLPKVSSHYAQISPLRGQGLPHPHLMGITSSQQHNNNSSVNASPVKSYFQELQCQDAAKSLPDINAVIPLTSPSIKSSGTTMTEVRSPVLLQPQALQSLRQSQSKPRSYSASSEILLSNAQYKFNQNTRALVGSPLHQYKRYNTNQRPRAASSSSMLQDSGIVGAMHTPVPHSRVYHPYQQLPGASLSLQTLNLNKGCVYLRPEQNIPEVFAHPGTVFKPIDEVENASDIVNDNVASDAISRDDIVVTMRSVNV